MNTEIETMQKLDVDSLDRETLLESLTLELMTDNIINQIDGRSESITNFLHIVTSKFNTILNEDVIDEDDKTMIKGQIVDFCDNLLCVIADKFGIAINLVDESYQANIDILTTLYNFLVVNKYSNVENCLIMFIQTNKSQLIETLGLVEKGKDITSMSNRKKNLDGDNVAILSGLNSVIDFIANGNIIDSEQFINLIYDGEQYVDSMKDYYDDGTIIGDFVPALFAMVLGDDYDNGEYTRIRNSIRVTLSQDAIRSSMETSTESVE